MVCLYEPSASDTSTSHVPSPHAAHLALADLLLGTVEDAPLVSKAILDRFGSLNAALAAGVRELSAIPAMTVMAVSRLAATTAVHHCALRETLAARDVIGSWQALERYVLAKLRCSPVEEARILLLDRKNGLIADEMLGRGTVDHVPLYPREVVRKALEHHASAVILVHNHPSGDPAPSSADIAMTRKVAAALATMDVALHDHAIVGRNRVLSMRGAGHF